LSRTHLRNFKTAFDALKGKGERINRLRDDLQTEKIASFFSEPHELAKLVLAATGDELILQAFFSLGYPLSIPTFQVLRGEGLTSDQISLSFELIKGCNPDVPANPVDNRLRRVWILLIDGSLPEGLGYRIAMLRSNRSRRISSN
jgi:hypothetical protein